MSYGFTMISNQLFNDCNLTMKEKFFLITLKKFDYKRTGIVYPTYELLMKDCGINKRSTISSIINSLEEKGYLLKKKRGRVNEYYLIKDYLCQ